MHPCKTPFQFRNTLLHPCKTLFQFRNTLSHHAIPCFIFKTHFRTLQHLVSFPKHTFAPLQYLVSIPKHTFAPLRRAVPKLIGACDADGFYLLWDLHDDMGVIGLILFQNRLGLKVILNGQFFFGISHLCYYGLVLILIKYSKIFQCFFG